MNLNDPICLVCSHTRSQHHGKLCEVCSCARFEDSGRIRAFEIAIRLFGYDYKVGSTAVLCDGVPILNHDRVLPNTTPGMEHAGWKLLQVKGAEQAREAYARALKEHAETEKPPQVAPPYEWLEWKHVNGNWYLWHDLAGDDEQFPPVPAANHVPIYRALIEAREWFDAMHDGRPFPGAPKRKAWTLPPLPPGYELQNLIPERVGLRYQHNDQPSRDVWIFSLPEFIALAHLVEFYKRIFHDDFARLCSANYTPEDP